MTPKELNANAKEYGPLISTISVLSVCIYMVLSQYFGKPAAGQTSTPPVVELKVPSDMLATNSKMASIVDKLEKIELGVQKVNDKLDPLGNRVTALEVRVNGIERAVLEGKE